MCEQLRQQVNALFGKPNTTEQRYINMWKKLKPLTVDMFESIWRRLGDSEFAYDDCALDGDSMKRGQERHGFERQGANYYSHREGRQHGLSVVISYYYYIYVHNNGEEVFHLKFNTSGKEMDRNDKKNEFGDLKPQQFFA